jgi:uncharacterized DUF497 family protein
MAIAACAVRTVSIQYVCENSARTAIGYTEGERLLFVVHVIRYEETIRIISAREATREERRQYENP